MDAFSSIFGTDNINLDAVAINFVCRVTHVPDITKVLVKCQNCGIVLEIKKEENGE